MLQFCRNPMGEEGGEGGGGGGGSEGHWFRGLSQPM